MAWVSLDDEDLRSFVAEDEVKGSLQLATEAGDSEEIKAVLQVLVSPYQFLNGARAVMQKAIASESWSLREAAAAALAKLDAGVAVPACRACWATRGLMSDGTPSSACGELGPAAAEAAGDVAEALRDGDDGVRCEAIGVAVEPRGVDAGARSASDRGDRLRIAEPQGGGRGGPRQAQCRGRGPACRACWATRGLMSDGTPSSACGSSGLRPRRPPAMWPGSCATGMTGSAAKRSGWPWSSGR